MSDATVLEHLALSVLASAVGLGVVYLLRTAPPRIVVFVGLASMATVFVPWTWIGAGVEDYLPFAQISGLEGASATSFLSSTASPAGAFALSYVDVALGAWFGVGFGWLGCTLLRFAWTKRGWRLIAVDGAAHAVHAHRRFAGLMDRTRVHVLPGTAAVFSTGFARPEIWVGEQVGRAAHLRAAMNHELCHIASGDQILLLLVVSLERLLWWNPLIWLLGRVTRRHMEYACDLRCQTLVGAAGYRNALAEMFLESGQTSSALQLPLGHTGGVIRRMERMRMNHAFRTKHALTLVAGVVLTAGASAIGASNAEPATLIGCHDLLPEGVQYDFRIRSEIDTRDGQEGELSITLLDATRPGSHDIPEGADEFLSCVKTVVGVESSSSSS